jgi:hypothetical protein
MADPPLGGPGLNVSAWTSRGVTAGVAGEAGPGCEAGHCRASGAGGL